MNKSTVSQTEFDRSDRTRIKYCGFTRRDDVNKAVALGVDALGFVFYPKSRRCVSVEQVHSLTRALPPFVTTVALFVDPQRSFVREVLDAMQPGLLQFHGDETPEDCAAYDWPYLKAFRVGGPGLQSPEALQSACLPYGQAAGWLFDSYTPAYGGSGHAFDHGLLAKVRQDPAARPMVLSGGLQTESVAGLIHDIQPWAVDVSSGIETEAGLKSDIKMQSFMQAVRSADLAMKTK